MCDAEDVIEQRQRREREALERKIAKLKKKVKKLKAKLKEPK